MDLNYDTNKWDFTLRTMSITKVTQQVLEAAIYSQPTSEDRQMVSKAREIAENLDLLPDMITEIIKMIPPIFEELYDWYEEHGCRICPILSPHGTVNIAKSARALIQSMDNADLPASDMFDLACDYCLEEQIFYHGKRLSNADKLLYQQEHHQSWTMQGFWYSVYEGNFLKMLTLNDLNSASLAEGTDRALYNGMFYVLKYFMKKGTREIIQPIIIEWNSINYINPFLSPDTCVMLFQIDQRESLEGMFSAAILGELLQWPYQHLFLKAAETMVVKLSLSQFWEIALKIIVKPAIGYEDYNYKGLFAGFWKMRKDYARAYVAPVYVNFLLTNVFLLRDKLIAFMVFDDLNELNKNEYLPFLNCVCAKLNDKEDCETLRFIIDVCKVKDEPLYIRFKRFAEANGADIDITSTHFPKRISKIFGTKDRINKLHEFRRLISEWEFFEQLQD